MKTFHEYIIQHYLSKLLLAFLSVFFLFGTAFSADESLTPFQMKVALIKSSLLGSNENDAAAAFKTFAKIVGRQKGYDVEVTVSIFQNADDLRGLPKEKRPHVVSLGSWLFLELEKEGWLTPIASSSIGEGKVCTPFKILVPAKSKVKTLEDLRGKNINILFTALTEIGLPWLQSLLGQHNLGTMASFFGDISIENDSMKAILPVFLGQKDAGLISAGKFKVMAELNPQLNTMRTITTSEPLLCGVTCVNAAEWSNSKVKEDFAKAMLELHLSPVGQQILQLFKTDQIMPYHLEDIETVRRLTKHLKEGHR